MNKLIEPQDLDKIDGTKCLLPVLKNPSAKVTAIIPTYNRSPYKKMELNPLYWSLLSLVKQKLQPAQIVVVNDGSNDHTQEVVSHVRKLGKFELTYVKNRTKQGLPKSFDIGIKLAKHELIYCFDDDCIATPYALWGAKYCFDVLNKSEKQLALVQLPVYKRSTIPTYFVPKSEIGKIDFNDGEITSNFEAFPLEYKKHQMYLDNKSGILRPFKIRNICFHFLAKKSLIKKAGVPTDFDIPNFYGEWTELAIRLMEFGSQCFFLPDPKFHAFHARYGYSEPKKLKGTDWWQENRIDGIESFNNIIAESLKHRSRTGCRVSDVKWYSSKIRGFLRVFITRSTRSGHKWIRYTYKNFVLRNDKNFRGVTKNIGSIKIRERIWMNAVRKELEIHYHKMNKMINKPKSIPLGRHSYFPL